ncbi:MAG: hypothetical protein IJA65_03610, partial [Acholeplasmatales bacterium]|nr:hypothetical protein [Acholeplasmatales bacterium]
MLHWYNLAKNANTTLIDGTNYNTSYWAATDGDYLWSNNHLNFAENKASNFTTTLSAGSLKGDFTLQFTIKPSESTFKVVFNNNEGLEVGVTANVIQTITIIRRATSISVYKDGTPITSITYSAGFISPEITKFKVDSNSKKLEVYGVRLHNIALSSSEFTNNSSRDQERYDADSVAADKIDIDNYVTKGIIVWLDGYYHYSNRTNTPEAKEKQLIIDPVYNDYYNKINNVYVVSRIKEIRYVWTNIDSAGNVTFDSAETATVVTDNEEVIVDGKTITNSKDYFVFKMPEANRSTGAWQLHLQLEDYAGNLVVYTYSEEYVVDKSDVKAIDISTINPNNDLVYNGDEVIEFVISFNKAVRYIGTSHAKPSMSIGGNNLKNEMTCTYPTADTYLFSIKCSYTVNGGTSLRSFDGDNGVVEIGYNLVANVYADSVGNANKALADAGLSPNNSRLYGSDVTPLGTQTNLMVDTIHPYVTKSEIIESESAIINDVKQYYYGAGSTMNFKLTINEDIYKAYKSIISLIDDDYEFEINGLTYRVWNNEIQNSAGNKVSDITNNKFTIDGKQFVIEGDYIIEEVTPTIYAELRANSGYTDASGNDVFANWSKKAVCEIEIITPTGAEPYSILNCSYTINKGDDARGIYLYSVYAASEVTDTESGVLYIVDYNGAASNINTYYGNLLSGFEHDDEDKEWNLG